MFEVAVRLKRAFFILCICLVTLPVLAANEDLETVEAPTLGERAATYLQAMVTAVSQTLALKPSSNKAINLEPFRATVTYNFDLMAIDISLVGTQTNEAAVKSIMEFARKLILGFNKKLDYNFGITLENEDIDIEYQNVLEDRVILRYQGGFYSRPDSKEEPGPKGSGK